MAHCHRSMNFIYHLVYLLTDLRCGYFSITLPRKQDETKKKILKYGDEWNASSPLGVAAHSTHYIASFTFLQLSRCRSLIAYLTLVHRACNSRLWYDVRWLLLMMK